MRSIYWKGQDRAPAVIQAIKDGSARLEGLPFHPELVASLGAIPNEYLYFYYYPRQSVENLQRAGQSRAQQILPFNQQLFASLRRIRDEEAPPESVEAVYARYLDQRHGTYMSLETGGAGHGGPAGEAPKIEQVESEDQIAGAAEGYSAVALGVIEALTQNPAVMILNVPNRGALPGMAEDDVVEATCFVGKGVVRPLATGSLPEHALGLMKMVKAYERLTIQAAMENSYSLAVKALALHPLVPSYEIAKAILDDYLAQHGDYFPDLR
jgi:6-phospho-beta-glucosidase